MCAQNVWIKYSSIYIHICFLVFPKLNTEALQEAADSQVYYTG